MDDGGKIVIDLAGQQFRIAPPDGDADRLLRAAALVSDKVRTIERAGIIATNRSALLAALEVALELIETRESPHVLTGADLDAGRKTIESMITRIDRELTAE